MMIKDVSGVLEKHQTKKYNKRDLSKVKYIVVHHSATDFGSPMVFAKHHVQKKGWPGIGYHFVIDKDGTTFVTNPIDTLSYHVARNNTPCIGICLIGNFDKYEPTKEQLVSLDQIIYSLQTILPNLEVRGHRDFKSTSCPGKLLYAEIQKVYMED